MILKMILKSFDFQCDFDFQITPSKMIWILILNHLYLGDLILILKSSTYDDFAISDNKLGCIYFHVSNVFSFLFMFTLTRYNEWIYEFVEMVTSLKYI